MAAILKTYADVQRYNFFCTPNWRWERVLSLVDRPGELPGRCSKRDDEIVRTARGFVVRWRGGDLSVRERLLFENPGLFYAYDFWQRLDDDPDSGMYIEARLLAGQTPEQIAGTIGSLPETVQWYADLFFDVGPRLKQRDWITQRVLIPALTRSGLPKGETPDDPDLVKTPSREIARPYLDGTLKMFAYFGGPHAVDAMIGGLQAGRPLSSPDDYDAWLDGNWSRTIRRRSNQAAQMFEVNKYNVMELFAVHTQIVALDRQADASDTSRTNTERHIRAMLDELPFAVGGDAEKIYDGTPVGQFDNMPAELRDDELLLIASGRAAESLGDSFLTELPPPRRDKRASITAKAEEM